MTNTLNKWVSAPNWEIPKVCRDVQLIPWECSMMDPLLVSFGVQFTILNTNLWKWENNHLSHRLWIVFSTIQIWKHSAIHSFQECLVLGLWKKMGLAPFFLKSTKETFFYVFVQTKKREYFQIKRNTGGDSHSLLAF